MSTLTPRLGLVKEISSENYSVNTVNNNSDKVDAAVGFEECTSSTRPSAPYNGKGIRESDTGSLLYSNGSSPASGSWKYIWNPDGPVIVGAVGSTAPLRGRTTSTIAGNRFLDARKQGEAEPGFTLDFDGKHQWGPGGSTAPDVNLYRSGANILATDDTLAVGGDLTLTGNLSVTGNGLLKPWGGVVVTTAGSLVTTSGSGESNISNLALSANGRSLVQNRFYLLCLQIEGNVADAGDQFRFRVRRDTALSGTTVGSFRWNSATVGGFNDTKFFMLPWKSPTNVSNAKLYVSVAREAGSGTMQVFGDSNTAFWVMDAGSDTAIWSTS